MMMRVMSSMTPEVKLLAVLKVWSEVLWHYDSWGEVVYGNMTPDKELSVVLWFPRGSCLWLLMKSYLQYYDSWWKVASGMTPDEKLPAVLQLLRKSCLQYYDSWRKVACGTITPVERSCLRLPKVKYSEGLTPDVTLSAVPTPELSLSVALPPELMTSAAQTPGATLSAALWFWMSSCQLQWKLLLLIAFISRYSPLSSRLTALTCDFTWVTSFLWCVFEYPPLWCTYSAVWLLHGWCHMKLLPSRRVLCTPYNHAPCHVTSLKATSPEVKLPAVKWVCSRESPGRPNPPRELAHSTDSKSCYLHKEQISYCTETLPIL